MTVTTRKVIRVGGTSFLASTDAGSGLPIVASEITVRRDKKIDLHEWRSKWVSHGIITKEHSPHKGGSGPRYA